MATLASPTLQKLLTSVRSNLNQRDPNNSWWTDVELTEYINDAVNRYFLECVEVNEGYFTTTTTLNILANTETVALPSDFFKMKTLWKLSSNTWVALPYNNTVTDSYSTAGGTSGGSYYPYYTFQGNNIVLRPTPNFSEVGGLQIEYIQFPTTMLWGGDTLTSQVSPIFKELIIMYAVYRAKLKESMVNGVVMHKIPEELVASLYADLKNTLRKRSEHPTYTIPFNPESY